MNTETIADKQKLEPWGVEQTTDTNWIGPMRDSGDGKVRIVVCSIDRRGLKDHARRRNDAWARIIAAAPEIIIAARSARCGCSTRGHSKNCWFPKLQIALAKAEGWVSDVR